jgi:hypothetical protein
MKKCSKCGKIKDESEFCKDKTRKSGLSNYCKTCWSKIHKENSHKYDDAIKQNRIIKTIKKDKIKVKCKKYRSSHIQIVSSREKTYRINHPEVMAKSIIKCKWGLDNPPDELVELKATQIRLFRAVRDKSMGVQDHGEGKDGEGSGRDDLRAHRRGKQPEVQAGNPGASRDDFRADVPAPQTGGA